jgi:predicted RNase H-like HicB family nuclease
VRYAVAIEPGDERTAWGVVVPDLPGCFSAGDTMDEALDNAREAIEAWVDAVVEDGGEIPAPKRVAEHLANKQFAGWLWGFVEIDPMRLDNTVERINITLPRRVIARIDAMAKAHGDSRSGTIARLALQQHISNQRSRALQKGRG